MSIVKAAHTKSQNTQNKTDVANKHMTLEIIVQKVI